MLEIEKKFGVSLTYNVVGCFLHEVKQKIEAAKHCVAFHSYDHDLGSDQLQMCRTVDSNLRGYRPPRNVLTTELNDENLRRHRFEWLATSASAFGFKTPRLENGIVKIPVLFDDFPLYKAKIPYELWEREALRQVSENAFAGVCLHDCYAQFWLPYYPTFLAKLGSLGQFRTFDQVAFDVRHGNRSAG